MQFPQQEHLLLYRITVRVYMTVVLAVLAWLAVVTSLAVAEGPVVAAGLAELGEMEKV